MKINENKKNSLKNHFNYSTSNPASLTAPAKSTSDTFSLSYSTSTLLASKSTTADSTPSKSIMQSSTAFAHEGLSIIVLYNYIYRHRI